MDPKLLEILVCPACKSSLEYRKAQQQLVCRPCRVAYRIVDGIPEMLADRAQPLKDEDLGSSQP